MVSRTLGQGLSVTPAAVVWPEGETAGSGEAKPWSETPGVADPLGLFEAAVSAEACGAPAEARSAVGAFVLKGSSSNTTTAATAIAINTGKTIRGKAIRLPAERLGRLFGV
jgi:hypothetical protein